MDKYQQLAVHLRRHGKSVTAARTAVFKALSGNEPRIMRQIITACPQIDRASVYRAIALFEQLGVIQRVQIGWKYKLELTENFSHHHHHMTCMRCGRIASFGESPLLGDELRQVAARKNFHIQSHLLELQGLCQQCAGGN